MMDLKTEIILKNNIILKPIPISPNDDYMAGSDGNIYSRTHYKGFGKKILVDWYPLKGHISNKEKGYLSISLCHNNIKITKSVHRLVCMAFHGMPAKSSLQVRHRDGNGGNNEPSNLLWGTQEENWQDRIEHGRIGNEHRKAFNEEEKRSIKWAIDHSLCSQHHAARVLGVSQATIHNVVKANNG